MSGSVQDFFNDVENTVNQAADNVETEIRDAANAVNEDSGAPSTTSPAAQVTRLYDSVFDRAPDDAGLTFWTSALRAGTGLNDLADLFVASPEFTDRYGENLGEDEFVALLYQNVLDREADPDGQAFWTTALQSGNADRADVVLAFSESQEHVDKVGPVSTGDNPLI
jgi:uncharacterized protein DUF4214